METCDQGGFGVRALREVRFDNGHALHFCGHHAGEAFPWMDAEVRFDPRHCLIVT